jgi:hypothetical protein
MWAAGFTLWYTGYPLRASPNLPSRPVVRRRGNSLDIEYLSDARGTVSKYVGRGVSLTILSPLVRVPLSHQFATQVPRSPPNNTVSLP